ncbi:hypothetical protein HXX76_007419 [Chlamydomonas incerta]|uniref:Mediator of RNA polymerase II transcription subunit 13 n=1 Tax=Chlamydomonas incerta TaxID=51695 RepID=A0A835T110_CHLIN|nr:hypothetical protein HXX76_007419 [Chlamydomonas incerta]|eukprot:KAG2435346.1 hypothetical protein HXX76_007419 [Chlamydomonas incerta]
MLGEGAARSGLLHSISDEALANTTATPSSASFKFVQLLAEVCARTGAQCGSGRPAPSDGERGREGPPPRRPQPRAPVLAPALALAAAAYGRCGTPQLDALPLEAPAALAGFQGDWLALQPAVLPFWDKVSLEPCGPQKAVEFYVVCPEQHSSTARMFVKDVSATFLAMRLGSHQPARTPSHLHAIDGVVPVPTDPGPGPPVGGVSGAGEGDAAAAAAAAAAWQQQQALARRPDRLVLRSAVLGFRSNHATASVASDLGWEPDEPSYRPRAGAVLPPGRTAAAGGGGAGAGAAAPPPPLQPTAPRQQQGPHVHFWRNLRHVGRQLQRHLLLQPPRELRQLNQQPRGGAGGGGGAGRGLSGGGAGGGGGPAAGPEAGAAGANAAGAAGASGAGNAAAVDPSTAGAAVGSGLLDLEPPALVVYVVPPSDSVEDVAAALMEVAACLAPVCPASRAPPAPVPLAASAGAAAGLAAELVAASEAGQAAGIARSLVAGGAGAGPGAGPAAWPGGPSVSSSVCGPQPGPVAPGGGGVAGSVAATLSSAGAGAALAALAAAGPPTGTSSSAASTPPEAPACSVGPVMAAGAGAAAAGDGSSGPGGAEGTGPNASGDTTDPALLARLGGAARHLYRATSWPAPVGAGGGGCGSSGGAAAAGPAGATPQLDLSQLAATELVIQLVLPSSLYDVTGACVRATACAAYTKLCRRLAGYGAAAATTAAAANTSSAAQGRAGARHAPSAQELQANTRRVQREGGGVVPACAGGAAVQASCSGRTPVYEPLLALAPPDVVARAAAAEAETAMAHPAGADAGGEVAAATAARARSPAPASLHGGAGGASVMAPGAAPPQPRPQPAPGAAAGHGVALAAPDRPTLHCCYAWHRCSSASSCRAGEGAAGLRAAGLDDVMERCWLAVAFCDSEGRVLDTRAMSLCSSSSGSSSSGGDCSSEGLGMGTAVAADGQERGDGAAAPCAVQPPTMAAASAAPVAVASDGAAYRSSLLPAGSSTSAMAAAMGPVAAAQQAEGGGTGSSSSMLALRTPCSCSMETDACPTAGEAERQSQPAPAPEVMAPLTLDALVCHAVLGHAQMLSRQLVAGGGTSAADEAGAAAGRPAHSKAGAATAADGGVAAGPPAARVTIAVTKLGGPTDAEAAAWQHLLAASDGGSCGSSSPQVCLSWLQLHPSVAVPQGFRLPPGGYVVRHASAPPAGGAAATTPVTLCAFPTQQPPSASCAATEGLSRHLRMLSIHTWPRPAHSGSLRPRPAHHQHQAPSAAQVDAVMADGVERAGDASAQPEVEDEAAAKRRRLDPDREPGGGASTGAAGADRLWSDPSPALLRQLAALCSLRDAMMAAQSGARGGPAPGGRYAAAAPTAGGAAAAGADVTLLLPLHVAVCQRLLRALVVCDRLAAAASAAGSGAAQPAAQRRAGA